MLFCFFCTRQTVSAQRGTNHQKVYNEHLYPKFWVRTKVQVYIYVYYTVMRCMLVMRVRVLVCLLCRPILPCSQYTMEVFFFAFFVFQPGFVAFVGVWLLWLYHALPIYLSIFLSFLSIYLSIYLSNLIYLILSI